MSTEKKKLRAAGFAVIEGGKSARGSEVAPMLSGPAVGAATAYALAEEERLRQAILQTHLPKSNVRISGALSELAQLDPESDVDEVQWRRSDLLGDLWEFGLSFHKQSSREDSEGARWVLGHPDRFLKRRPETAPHYPLAHHMMVVAWGAASPQAFGA